MLRTRLLKKFRLNNLLPKPKSVNAVVHTNKSRAHCRFARFFSSNQKDEERDEAYSTGLAQAELYENHRCVIFRPSPTVTQSARAQSMWKIELENTEKWSNPLMGWTSSRDPSHVIDLNFDTLEEAIEVSSLLLWQSVPSLLSFSFLPLLSCRCQWNSVRKAQQYGL